MTKTNPITIVTVTVIIMVILVMAIAVGMLHPAEAIEPESTTEVSADLLDNTEDVQNVFPFLGETTGSAVRFRKYPNTSSVIYEEMKRSSRMTVFSEENGWYYVRRNDTYGYVKAEFVQPVKMP